MSWIDDITPQNFNSSFNLKNILTDSVFYPASGTDGRDLSDLSQFSQSFIHVDYSVSKDQLTEALINELNQAGYQPIGVKSVAMHELYSGTKSDSFPLPLIGNNKQVLHLDKKLKEGFVPYAVWAVFSLIPEKKGDPSKEDRFSILHIGWEGCSAYEGLYHHQKINPIAIAICYPGTGWGENWTDFRDHNAPFYRQIKTNVEEHGLSFPRYLLTHLNEEQCNWPDYHFLAHSRFPHFGIFEYRPTGE